ncbi:hypothetical protein [Haliscomenobacter sp.]|uniref:hypothetical protein n=1 Tax=Haliscomenobacter sp. TaxID=2717303 RepID=UPI00336507C5
MRQTKTKYSSAEEYLPKAFHFSKWKAFFASETGSLSVAEAPGRFGFFFFASQSGRFRRFGYAQRPDREAKRKTLAEPLQQGPLTQTNKHKNYFKML